MSESPAENPGETPDELTPALRLALVSGVGPRLWKRLLERFGTPEAVLGAAPSALREVEGVGPKVAQSIAKAGDEIDVADELAVCQANGISILLQSRPEYPELLRQIYDPPAVLFARGNLLPRDGLALAIVGTRHATQYGLRQAERLAGSLARAGLTIVSGLARGIDAAAHRGALAAGGRTVAVLAGGVLTIYPPEHDTLAAEVMAQGVLLSEAPSRASLQSGMFPQRNRIISGLSLGVLVIEAGDRSGALITARQAMEQGREVFAMPGRVDDRSSHGCHRLIRDGAKLVETADDVLEELGPLFQPTPGQDGQVVHHPGELLLNEVEQQILAVIGSESMLIDEIIVESGLPAAQVVSTLNVLEMRRMVRRQGGATVTRI
jgi:DNA processing protein